MLGGLACAALPYARAAARQRRRHGRSSASPAPWPARLWIALAGWLRQYRGINETISSLLLAYIAIGIFKHLVEGAAARPGQPEQAVDALARPTGCCIGGIGGVRRALGPGDRHRGLPGLGLWLRVTASGFSMRVVGGNPRTAQLVGLPATRLILVGLRRRRRLRAAWRARSRWRRCTPTPTPR